MGCSCIRCLQLWIDCLRRRCRRWAGNDLSLSTSCSVTVSNEWLRACKEMSGCHNPACRHNRRNYHYDQDGLDSRAACYFGHARRPVRFMSGGMSLVLVMLVFLMMVMVPVMLMSWRRFWRLGSRL